MWRKIGINENRYEGDGLWENPNGGWVVYPYRVRPVEFLKIETQFNHDIYNFRALQILRHSLAHPYTLVRLNPQFFYWSDKNGRVAQVYHSDNFGGNWAVYVKLNADIGTACYWIRDAKFQTLNDVVAYLSQHEEL